MQFLCSQPQMLAGQEMAHSRNSGELKIWAPVARFSRGGQNFRFSASQVFVPRRSWIVLVGCSANAHKLGMSSGEVS